MIVLFLKFAKLCIDEICFDPFKESLGSKDLDRKRLETYKKVKMPLRAVFYMRVFLLRVDRYTDSEGWAGA